MRVRLTPDGAALAASIPACVLQASGRSNASVRDLVADLAELRDTLNRSEPG